MEENKVTSENQTLSDQRLRERAIALRDEICRLAGSIDAHYPQITDAIFRELRSVRDEAAKFTTAVDYDEPEACGEDAGVYGSKD